MLSVPRDADQRRQNRLQHIRLAGTLWSPEALGVRFDVKQLALNFANGHASEDLLQRIGEGLVINHAAVKESCIFAKATPFLQARVHRLFLFLLIGRRAGHADGRESGQGSRR